MEAHIALLVTSEQPRLHRTRASVLRLSVHGQVLPVHEQQRPGLLALVAYDIIKNHLCEMREDPHYLGIELI